MGVSDKLRFVAVTLAEPTKDQIKRSWRPLPHHPTTHSFIHPLSHQLTAVSGLGGWMAGLVHRILPAVQSVWCSIHLAALPESS